MGINIRTCCIDLGEIMFHIAFGTLEKSNVPFVFSVKPLETWINLLLQCFISCFY